ncbi:hypothetical protein DSM104299_03460 [Baekduia alba]|uniref:hypothetical protein n=1 Tax=Baekduia alba TaxID=2997333 RepID=UPI0023427D05|nr:hypothetical protein [Baekduia alba]WCB94721.1 hypothetical protein DSM104299_03460 [Baekduia alba]
MRVRAPILTVALALPLASCGSGSDDQDMLPTATASVIAHPVADTTVARLELAIVKNPNNEARAAQCRRATAADRRIGEVSFGGHPRRLYACVIALHALPPATYDVMVLGNGCFVGHRRTANAADYGCMR